MVMLKPELQKRLGKGLGELLNGDAVAGSGRCGNTPREMGRGLNTLVTVKEPEQAPAKKVLLPAWFFFAADILLLAYAVAICFDAPKPLDLGTVLFCGTSITLGAVLAVIGILREV